MASPGKPITDRRPDPKQYTKWESQLPFNLEDFMNQYVAWKLDGVSHPQWKQNEVAFLEKSLHDMIRVHWKESSKTRKLFVAMNADHVWQDKQMLTMHLTKRNLATLDPKFIPVLDKFVLDHMTSLIETIRSEAQHILDATYANANERKMVETITAGSDAETYNFNNYGRHLQMQADLRAEFKAKYGVLETLRQREIFVQKLVRFEELRREKANDNVKGRQNVNNWLPKFRSAAAKSLLDSNERAKVIMDEYTAKRGKTFLLLGENYFEEYLEKQKGEIARIVTNFSHFTENHLFLNKVAPGGRERGDGRNKSHDVVDRVLHEDIEWLADDVHVDEPIPMPEFADDLLFTFEYY